MRKTTSHPFAIAVILLVPCCLLFQGFPAHATTDQGTSSPRQPHFSGDPDGAGILPLVGWSRPPAGRSQVVDTPKVGLGINSQRHISGGSDGVGILPFTGVPGSPAGRTNVGTTPTVGLVIDANRHAVAGTLVVVTHPALGVVAHTLTEADGHFVVNIPAFAHLELALPDEALSGIDITASVPIIIVAP